MEFPSSEIPRPRTPPSPTACRSDPFISNQNFSNLEHQFLYYPPETSADSLTYDTSSASNGDISVNSPAELQQALPVILSTPPTGHSQNGFGLGPAFEERYKTTEGNSQLCFSQKQESHDESLPDHFAAHRATFDASPFVASVDCSPAPSSFTLGTPLLSACMPLQPTSRPTSAASENAKIPNIRKRSPSHIRISSLSLRASSPLSQTHCSQAQPAAVTQGAVRKPCSDDESKWYQEYIRVSKELQALQKQFAGIQGENCDLKVENRTLKSDLAWALGLNHYLPKIQNYVHGAQIVVGGGNGGQPSNVTENTTNTTSYAPVTLPPMPAPMPAQPPYIYDNLSVAKTAFPHISPKTASTNQAQKRMKDYKLPVVHTQYHPRASASATTMATWSTSYASLPSVNQKPDYRQMAPSPASGQKRSRMEID